MGSAFAELCDYSSYTSVEQPVLRKSKTRAHEDLKARIAKLIVEMEEHMDSSQSQLDTMQRRIEELTKENGSLRSVIANSSTNPVEFESNRCADALIPKMNRESSLYRSGTPSPWNEQQLKTLQEELTNHMVHLATQRPERNVSLTD